MSVQTAPVMVVPHSYSWLDALKQCGHIFCTILHLLYFYIRFISSGIFSSYVVILIFVK